MRVLEHWTRMPPEVVESPPLEILNSECIPVQPVRAKVSVGEYCASRRILRGDSKAQLGSLAATLAHYLLF